MSNLITVGAPSILIEDVECKIEEAFERGAELDARRIKVNMRDGKVILTGCVRSSIEREEDEDAARSVSGVLEVENQIAVVP